MTVSVFNRLERTTSRWLVPALYIFHLHWMIRESSPLDEPGSTQHQRSLWLQQVLDAFADEIQTGEDLTGWRSATLNPVLVRAFHRADDFDGKAIVKIAGKAAGTPPRRLTLKHWEGFYLNLDVVAPVHHGSWCDIKSIASIPPEGSPIRPTPETFGGNSHFARDHFYMGSQESILVEGTIRQDRTVIPDGCAPVPDEGLVVVDEQAVVLDEQTCVTEKCTTSPEDQIPVHKTRTTVQEEWTDVLEEQTVIHEEPTVVQEEWTVVHDEWTVIREEKNIAPDEQIGGLEAITQEKRTAFRNEQTIGQDRQTVSLEEDAIPEEQATLSEDRVTFLDDVPIEANTIPSEGALVVEDQTNISPSTADTPTDQDDMRSGSCLARPIQDNADISPDWDITTTEEDAYMPPDDALDIAARVTVVVPLKDLDIAEREAADDFPHGSAGIDSVSSDRVFALDEEAGGPSPVTLVSAGEEMEVSTHASDRQGIICDNRGLHSSTCRFCPTPLWNQPGGEGSQPAEWCPLPQRGKSHTHR